MTASLARQIGGGERGDGQEWESERVCVKVRESERGQEERRVSMVSESELPEMTSRTGMERLFALVGLVSATRASCRSCGP